MIATGSFDGKIRIWNLAQKALPDKILEGHTQPICKIAFSPDGKSLVSGSMDQTAILWNLEEPSPSFQILTGHAGPVICVAFSHSGKYMLTASADKTAWIWDISKSPFSFHVLDGHSIGVISSSFSKDDLCIFAVSNRNIHLWDIKETPAKCKITQVHDAPMSCAAFSPDNHFILTGSLDKTAQLWDLRKSTMKSQVLRHSGSVSCVTFSDDGKFILTGCSDSFHIWDTHPSLVESQTFQIGDEYCACSGAISPNNRFILIGCSKGNSLFLNTGGNASLYDMRSKQESLDVKDLLLLLKLKLRPDSLDSEKHTTTQLRTLALTIGKEDTNIANAIDCFLTGLKLPEKTYSICEDSYNSSNKKCQQLSCCKKRICKSCFNKQFIVPQDKAKIVCPFCRRPRAEIGSPVDAINKNNHRCAACFKENITSRCSGCKEMYYCTQECQKAHWKGGHNKGCLLLQQKAKESASQVLNS